MNSNIGLNIRLSQDPSDQLYTDVSVNEKYFTPDIILAVEI